MSFRSRMALRIREAAYRRGVLVQRTTAAEFLPGMLERIRLRRQRLKVLQIGGNDGRLADPLGPFLRADRPGVEAVILEPIPDYFAMLKRTYRRHPSVRPVQLAVHADQRSAPVYRLDPAHRARYPDWAQGLASFDRTHLEGHGVDTDAILVEQVPCRTVAEVLAEFDFEDVNVVVIDTEGYDPVILGMLDISTPTLEIVRFEHNFSRGVMSREDLDAWGDRFHAAGFEFLVDAQDATAVRRYVLTIAKQGLADSDDDPGRVAIVETTPVMRDQAPSARR